MMREIGRWGSGWLLAALCAAAPLAAQEAPARGGLKIYVLQGEQAVNNIRTGAATPPVVEVRDANDFPVAGAEVVFRTPETGPSATFEGGRHEYTNRTDAKGQVSAGQMKPNGQEGVFSIQVTAKLGERTAVAVIRQRNSRDEYAMGGSPTAQRKSFWRRNRWWVAGVLAGTGAGLGYFFATRDTSSGAVLRPGTVVIGGPR
ncbi:MAG: hypothetical protein KatS3mg004_0281 [Bryobacteraceae bacterium]|nr:MAG: hypothetical protein KatS3mg004_0281 [Bryobacteraceae bacterium]